VDDDKLVLRGASFFGYHGTTVEERTLGQRFNIDLEVSLSLSQAGISDNLQETVDYSQLYQTLKQVLHGPPRQLLESLAESITGHILTEFPMIQAVKVRVSKTNPPIQGAVVGIAAAEISRRRNS